MTTVETTSNAETENDTLELFPPASTTSPTPPSLAADNPTDDNWEKEFWPPTPPEPPLVEGEGVRQVHIGWLKPHPFSVKVYGHEAVDKVLVKSIEDMGILEPLKVTVDGVVISGHRRHKAAKQTHLETVPVVVVCARSRPGAVEELILEANRAREKNNEQRLREFIAYKVIETARAKERNGYRWDLVPNSARGDAEPKPGVYPHPLTTLKREVGKARDLAAAKVGMGGSTAADGEKVVAALDHLWAEESYRDHGQLREALLKSIHAALQLGLERGWIPKPVHKPKRKDRATTSAVPAGHPGDEPDHDLEDIDEPADDHGPRNTTDASVDVAGMAEDPSTTEALTPLPQTGSDPYRDRQLPAHDAVAELPHDDLLPSREDTSPLPSVVTPSNPAVPVIAPAPVANPGEGSPTITGAITQRLPLPPAPGHGLAGEPGATDRLVTSEEKSVVNTNRFTETGENIAAEDLLPPDKVGRIVEAVTTRSVDSANYDLVPLIRYLVPEIAAVLNRAKHHFPEDSGHQLSRATSFAHGKIQVAMKWM